MSISTQDIKKQLNRTISDFRRSMQSMLREEAEQMGCSVSYVETLKYVALNEKPLMKEIAEHLGITPPSVTTLVEAMIKKGLLRRVHDNTDRRSIHVSLTSKAWKLFKSLEDKKETVIGKMFSVLSNDEKRELIRILERVTTYVLLGEKKRVTKKIIKHKK